MELDAELRTLLVRDGLNRARVTGGDGDKACRDGLDLIKLLIAC